MDINKHWHFADGKIVEDYVVQSGLSPGLTYEGYKLTGNDNLKLWKNISRIGADQIKERL